MKKLIVILVVLFAASTTFAQISNTAHDFSMTGKFNDGGEICIVCHTPHNADVTVTDTPLWNHEVTGATFTLYSSSTLDASDLGQPDGGSKLCLSCHDGTVAMDNFGGEASGTEFIATGKDLTEDLSDDHPVSFTYDGTLVTADGGLVAHDDASVAALLIGGKVECASCHNAHNNANGNFLVMSNAASALCLTCHAK